MTCNIALVNNKQMKLAQCLNFIPEAVISRVAGYLNVNFRWKQLMDFHPVLFDDNDMKTIQESPNPARNLVQLWCVKNLCLREFFLAIFYLRLPEPLKLLTPFVHPFLKSLKYIMEAQMAGSNFLIERDLANNEKFEIAFDDSIHNNLPQCFHIKNIHELTPNYIEAITYRNNKQMLGRSLLGETYKGTWGGNCVVIKKISNTGPGNHSNYNTVDQQWLRTTLLLNLVSHCNLVPLVGVCIENHFISFVYSYQDRMSVYDSLVGKGPILDWMSRIRVAKDVIRGLSYLNTCLNVPLHHGNLKTTNILLDYNNEAKLCDYTFSRRYLENNIVFDWFRNDGYAHWPYEYVNGGELNGPVDAYSFGVVLAELATGIPYHKNMRSHFHAFRNLPSEVFFELADSNIKPTNFNESMVSLRLMILAIECTQPNPGERTNFEEIAEGINTLWDLMKIKWDELVVNPRNNLMGDDSLHYMPYL